MDSAAVDNIRLNFSPQMLTLLNVVNFFDGLGGMAIIAGLRGIWHIVSGLTVAFLFNGVRLSAAPKEVVA